MLFQPATSGDALAPRGDWKLPGASLREAAAAQPGSGLGRVSGAAVSAIIDAIAVAICMHATLSGQQQLLVTRFALLGPFVEGRLQWRGPPTFQIL